MSSVSKNRSHPPASTPKASKADIGTKNANVPYNRWDSFVAHKSSHHHMQHKQLKHEWNVTLTSHTHVKINEPTRKETQKLQSTPKPRNPQPTNLTEPSQ